MPAIRHASPIDLPKTAVPANPESGRVVLYALADGRLYSKDDTGVVARMDNTVVLPFSHVGAVAVGTGASRVPILWPCVIEAVAAMVNTAPTGASLIVDVNLNGTTIYATQANRPTIAAGANVATVGAHSITSAVAGNYLSVDRDQVGSTVAGSDLVVVVSLRRTG